MNPVENIDKCIRNNLNIINRSELVSEYIKNTNQSKLDKINILYIDTDWNAIEIIPYLPNLLVILIYVTSYDLSIIDAILNMVGDLQKLTLGGYMLAEFPERWTSMINTKHLCIQNASIRSYPESLNNMNLTSFCTDSMYQLDFIPEINIVQFDEGSLEELKEILDNREGYKSHVKNKTTKRCIKN